MDISFIIPVYNVEQYIAKAIFSVIETDWQDLMYEIIIIDDESPDNSIAIVENILSKNPSFPIKIISQKNKGLGGARNTGISVAKGEYLFFLDSDDYIIPETFPYLVQKAKISHLDILEFASCRVDSDYKLIDTIFLNTTNEKILTGEQYVAEIDFANSACNKLYRNLFLKSQNIRFLEKVYIEDAPFNVEVFSKALRIMAVDKIGAAYLQNVSSITRSKRTSTYLTKFINDSILVTERINYIALSFKNKKASEKIRNKTAYFLTGILWMILRANHFTRQDKRAAIASLKEKSLFPYYHKTGSVLRDIFLFPINILGSLRIL